MTVQELRDKRGNAWLEMQNLVKTGEERSLTAEEREKYAAFEKDYDNLEAEIELREKHQGRVDAAAETRTKPVEVAATITQPEDDTEKRYAGAFNRFLRFGMNDLSSEERSMLRQNFKLGDDTEKRAQGTGTTAGGYLIPTPFRNRLIEAQLTYQPVRQNVEVITTDSGASLPWPTVDDTTNLGAILAENTQVTEQDVAFGTASLDVYMYTSKLVRASLQVLQDAAVDIEGFLARALGTRIGRIHNAHFTTGTGSAQPLGISTNATIGKTGTTGQTLTVIYGDLIDLIDSIDPAYESNAAFMMKASTLGAIRKLVDGQSRPLWEPSLQAGVPSNLLGYRVIINNDMPAMAANARSILFGDFRAGYVIRDVTDVRQLRLEERYADYLQVGFLAFQRAGGTVQNASAYKAYRNSAT